MTPMYRVCALALALGGLPALALAAEQVPQATQGQTYAADAQKAKALLAEAVAFYKEQGDKALPVFSRQGPFIKDDLYVYVVNANGVMLASGGPSMALIGRDISSVLDKDLVAKFKTALADTHSDAVQEAEYPWRSWDISKPVRKHVYYQRVNNHILAVGYYQPHASAEQAKSLLENAVQAIQKDPQESFKAINNLDPRFFQEDLYVFAVDLDSKRFVAHGSTLRLVGTNFVTLKDTDGNIIGQKMLDLVDDKNEAEYQYQWRNPVTNKNEPKHVYLRKVGNYLVAVGSYTRP
jgi:cytochrome c